MYDGKNILNAVQNKKRATKDSIVDVGNFILVRSGPTLDPSVVDFLISEPSSVRVDDAAFRSWVMPTSRINLVPSAPSIGETNSVSAGTIGMMFCCANAMSEGGAKKGNVKRYGK